MAALSKNSAVRLLNGNIQIDTPLKHAARAYEEATGKTSAWHWMGQPSNLAQDYTGIIFQNFASGVINTEQFVQNMKNAVSAGIASWRA